MSWHPPVARMAVAFCVGCGLAVSGEFAATPPVLLLLFAAPILPWPRPGLRTLLLSSLAGFVWGAAWLRTQASDCRLRLPPSGTVVVEGSFAGRGDRGATEFDVVSGLPGGCRGRLRAVVLEGAGAPEPGELVRGRALWRRRDPADPARPDRVGTLVFVELERGSGREPPRVALLRGRVQRRLEALYGARAPLVDALVLARREGIDPQLREAFAISGTAHLLAISGFHVGVIAGILLGSLRVVGVGRARSAVVAALGVWGYVAVIGFPYAASRAAAILTLIAAGRIRGRPVTPTGALATALLLLLLVDPGAVGSPGFQLSFAGAAGLILLAHPLQDRIRSVERRLVPTGSLPRWATALTTGARSALVAGVAATLPTIPLIAWHFDRVSLVGVPATMLAGPLVALAIPGILVSLVLSGIHPGLGDFLAGGVDVLLVVLIAVVKGFAQVPWAAPWIPRAWLAASALTGAAAWLALARAERIRPAVRRCVVATVALSGAVLAPVVNTAASLGTLELVFLDVGQGDAIALRSPRGRWVLIDAGPSNERFDAGERTIVPYFRRRDVGGLDAMVLTHPDLDHVGGAASVLAGLRVGTILDPGLPAGKEVYVRLLRQAAEQGARWLRARRGTRIAFDGVSVEVLHAGVTPAQVSDGSTDANDASIVLLVSFGAFRALLAGDAPSSVEVTLTERDDLSSLELLKVGHHGSATSSSWQLLGEASPEVAVISVGRANRYGHPSREVLDRLRRAGARILRTDLHGTVTVRARPDGSYRVATTRDRT